MARMRSHSQQGSIPLVMLAAIAVGGLAIVLLGTVMTSERQVRLDRDFQESAEGADLGLNQAIATIRTMEADDSVPASGEFTRSGSVGSLQYTYRAEKTSGEWEVRASSTSGERSRHVEATVTRTTLFNLAAFGKTLVGFQGGNGALSYSDAGADTGEGAVGTNGSIELNGNSYADWLDLYGPDAECTKTASNCQDMEDDGNIRGHAEPHEPQTAFIETTLAENWCTDSIDSYVASTDGTLQGGEGPGPDGEYCFSSMDFDVDTDVDATNGAFVAYVSGDVTSDNEVEINCPQCPGDSLQDLLSSNPPESQNLQIYSSGGQVALGNHTHFAAAVHAPKAVCRGDPSNAQAFVYGSMTCNSINNQGGWTFAYDENLGDVAAGEWQTDSYREEFEGESSHQNLNP